MKGWKVKEDRNVERKKEKGGVHQGLQCPLRICFCVDFQLLHRLSAIENSFSCLWSSNVGSPETSLLIHPNNPVISSVTWRRSFRKILNFIGINTFCIESKLQKLGMLV